MFAIQVEVIHPQQHRAQDWEQRQANQQWHRDREDLFKLQILLFISSASHLQISRIQLI